MVQSPRGVPDHPRVPPGVPWDAFWPCTWPRPEKEEGEVSPRHGPPPGTHHGGQGHRECRGGLRGQEVFAGWRGGQDPRIREGKL